MFYYTRIFEQLSKVDPIQIRDDQMIRPEPSCAKVIKQYMQSTAGRVTDDQSVRTIQSLTSGRLKIVNAHSVTHGRHFSTESEY